MDGGFVLKGKAPMFIGLVLMHWFGYPRTNTMHLPSVRIPHATVSVTPRGACRDAQRIIPGFMRGFVMVIIIIELVFLVGRRPVVGRFMGRATLTLRFHSCLGGVWGA